MLDMGGADYAFQKLKRWRAEGQTERNRMMARFLVDNGYLGLSWSREPSDQTLLLANLALEWNDFAMWEGILKRITRDGFTTQSGLGLLVRAWDVFTFDRTKHMFVHPVRISMPYSIAYIPFIQRALQN